MKENYMEKRYKLNRNTSVVVKSKLDGNVYKNTITLTHESADLEPLIKGTVTRTQIADKIADIDMESDNAELFGDDE